jgi:hypothetical protein
MDTNFNFQEWALLAKTSPEAFEKRRRETINEFLSASSDRQRRFGLGLQREIDFEIKRANNPQAALAVIAKMMWDQVAFLCAEVNTLSTDIRELQGNPAVETKKQPDAPAPVATGQSIQSRMG